MRTPELVRSAAVAIALVSLAACSRQPTRDDAREAAREIRAGATRAGDELKVAASHAGEEFGDAWITTKIQSQYFADEDIKARHLNVTTRDGRVTLAGRVDDQNAHDQALQTAKNTDGVREVVDQLVVGPPSQTRAGAERITAAWLATKIQAKYFVDPTVRSRDINVTSINGVVTLSGRVDSEQEKQQAIALARNTDGVSQVEDRLVVNGAAAVATSGTTAASVATAATRPPIDDARIATTIQSKYFLDDLVKGRRIDVDAKQGVVTLRGDVNSEVEHSQALLLARTTDGVQRVEDALSVTAIASSAVAGTAVTAPAGTRTPVGTAADDESLATTVQSRFYQNSQLRGGSVEVTSKDGVVLLQGTVTSQAARRQAVEAARSTEGVVQVIDRLKVAAPARKRATR